MKELFLIAGFGALGALARHGVNLVFVRLTPGHFPWATLVVNVVGCFLIGLVYSASYDSKRLSPELALVLSVGFLGALTTVSGFALQTWMLGEGQHYGLATLNVVANIALGLLAVWGGLGAARMFWPAS